MLQLWILVDNSVELPTDSTTAWTTLCVAHIPTTFTTTFYLKNNNNKN
jgi:hypothetical protein